jgi:hypothetical protein
MKWFKHDSDAHADAKLRKVRLKYGMQGYGLYWYCLELIARGVEKHRLTFELEHDAELIADDTGISRDLVEDMMRFMSDIGLFEQSCGVITCLKMAHRTDEYTAKLISKSPNVPIVSRQHPDSLGTKSVLLEEKRREEKRTDKKESGRRFTPPTREELSCFISLESLNVDPAAFIDHYESKGWLVGKARMKDWRAAARGWSRRQDAMPKPKTRARSITEDLTDRSWAQ